MDAEGHFRHPEKTLRWAETQIDQFEVAERTFFEECPGKEFDYVEFATTQRVHVIDFAIRPTEEMEEKAYRAVGDLRNALDHAVYASCKSLGVLSLKRANFPVGDNRIHFERQLASPNGPFRDIPATLHPILAGFKPYYSDSEDGNGNHLLRALAEMANPNKHQLPLGIEVQTGMQFYGAKGGILGFGTRWNWKGRTELYRTVPGVPYEIDIKLDPRIAFGEVAGMAGKPVTRTLREMLPMVQEIVFGLKSEVERLLR